MDIVDLLIEELGAPDVEEDASIGWWAISGIPKTIEIGDQHIYVNCGVSVNLDDISSGSTMIADSEPGGTEIYFSLTINFLGQLTTQEIESIYKEHNFYRDRRAPIELYYKIRNRRFKFNSNDEAVDKLMSYVDSLSDKFLDDLEGLKADLEELWA